MTRTASPKAVCPNVNPQAKISLGADYSNLETTLLNFLNFGGTVNSLQRVFQAEEAKQKPDYLSKVQAVDVTGDKVPEILVWFAEYIGDIPGIPIVTSVFPGHVQASRVYVFTCNQGAYMTLATLKDAYYNNIAMPSVVDLNADGVPEIIQAIYDFAGSGYGLYLSILEWDGSTFANLIDHELGPDFLSTFSASEIRQGTVYVANGTFELRDIDKNGTTEVVISSDWNRGQSCELFYRETHMVLMWDGRGFTGFYQRTPAKYRIQAIWDGDEASVHGRLGDAIVSYKKALSDETLLSWSPAYRDLQSPLCNGVGQTVVPPTAVPDKNEKPRLEAYALYRLMLLSSIQQDIAGMQTTYQALRDKYQAISASLAYFHLAEVFWNEYSSSGSTAKACQAVVAYADIHQDTVLAPLDRNTYGGFTPIYLPETIICPFN